MTTDYFDSDEFKQEHAAYLRRNPKAVAARMETEASTPERLQPVETVPRSLNAPEIIEEALGLTLRMLAPSNPNPSEIHKSLLRATLETLVRNAFGELEPRVIVGLPTGAGKTTCIAAAIFTLHKHGLLETHPVLVLAEQIAAGKELRALLVEGYGKRTGLPDDEETGLPENLIAHVYNSDDGGEPPEAADVTPVCIATHKRTRMVKDIRRLLVYEGLGRACWIDEGILASSAFGVTADKAKAHLVDIHDAANAALVRNTFKRKATMELDANTCELVKLAEWAEAALVVYERERNMLRAETVRAIIASENLKPKQNRIKISRNVALPEPTFDVDWAIAELKTQRVNEMAYRILEAASVAPESFTLVSTGAEQNVLQHRRILPPELDHGVVVLDAGAEVDALQKLDAALVNAETLPWWPKRPDGWPVPASDLKDWSNVTLHWMQTHSGKGTVADAKTFNQLVGSVAKFIAEHAQPGDDVLVCTYESLESKLITRLPDEVRELRKDLTVACEGDTRARECQEICVREPYDPRVRGRRSVWRSVQRRVRSIRRCWTSSWPARIPQPS